MTRKEVGAALLVAVGVLLGTGLMRLAYQGAFRPAWFWVIASAIIALAAPPLRRRLDQQDP